MKKSFLTIFFSFSYFFMPFVVSSCGGKDEPYDVSALQEEETDCQSHQFLVLDCIDEEKAEQESKTPPAEEEEQEEETDDSNPT